MDVLIHFNEHDFLNSKTAYESQIPVLQNVVNAYNQMNLPALNPAEFGKLFTQAEDLIFDKMTDGKEVSIAGLKVNKTKALEILMKPEGYDLFLQAIQDATIELQNVNNHLVRNIDSPAISYHYTINETGTVILNPEFEKRLKITHQRWAKSDKAKKMLQFAKTLIQYAEEHGVGDLIRTNPNGFPGFVKEFFEGGDGKPLSIRVQGILNLN